MKLGSRKTLLGDLCFQVSPALLLTSLRTLHFQLTVKDKIHVQHGKSRRKEKHLC